MMKNEPTRVVWFFPHTEFKYRETEALYSRTTLSKLTFKVSARSDKKFRIYEFSSESSRTNENIWGGEWQARFELRV